MIRNDQEYREAVPRLTEEKQRIVSQKAELEQMELSSDDVKRVLDPMRSFHL